VDAIAAALDRDRSYVVNQALADYIETHRWHARHVRKGLREAEDGQFVPNRIVRATIQKLRRK
jgi:predicted transcriptional regulator